LQNELNLPILRQYYLDGRQLPLPLAGNHRWRAYRGVRIGPVTAVWRQHSLIFLVSAVRKVPLRVRAAAAARRERGVDPACEFVSEAGRAQPRDPFNLTAVKVHQERMVSDCVKISKHISRGIFDDAFKCGGALCATILVRRGLYPMLEIGTSTRPMSAISIGRRLLLLTAGLGILAPPGFTVADGIPDAAVPIQGLCDALLTIMKAGRTTPFPQRFAMLAPAVDRALDLPYILQEAVGPRPASATPEQQSELQSAFRSYTIATYVANFDNYSGDRFEVSPELREVANGDQIVRTRFVPPSGDARVIDYVMRQTDGSWKAGDVLLDGTISRAAVLRSEFRHLLAEGGFDALLRNLGKKVADLSGGTITE
jgi:phospholipid transport system substrate-binding protein